MLIPFFLIFFPSTCKTYHLTGVYQFFSPSFLPSCIVFNTQHHPRRFDPHCATLLVSCHHSYSSELAHWELCMRWCLSYTSLLVSSNMMLMSEYEIWQMLFACLPSLSPFPPHQHHQGLTIPPHPPLSFIISCVWMCSIHPTSSSRPGSIWMITKILGWNCTELVPRKIWQKAHSRCE